MSIITIIVLTVMAVTIGLIRKGKGSLLLAFSTILVFFLQPRFDLEAVTFLVPLATIGIAIISWALTSSGESRSFKKNWSAFAIILVITFLIWANRYFKVDIFFETNTPSILIFLGAWIAIVAIFFVVFKLLRWQKGLIIAAFVSLIFAFILIKSPQVAGFAHWVASKLIGRTTKYAPFMFQWFGYSYIAFRILHTYLEHRAGRMPEVTLEEYVNYVIFFPALAAGPIDRIQRFLADLRNPRKIDNDSLLFSGKRIVIGLFKKFVIADALALISIAKFDLFIKYPIWLWILLYTYSFRIYLDFSGYTDIAIGVGRLAGIQLPENFNYPYVKSNITLFWNSWHITLTQWFRGYVFNPLVRKFRQAKRQLPEWGIVLISQMGTMILIGLWHGISLNFILWGAWHGLGLFFHNRWTAITRNKMEAINQKKYLSIAIKTLGMILTFNFVALGWLFFVLPSTTETFLILGRMFGIGG